MPHVDLATWDFTVTGEVESPIRLTFDELQALPQTEITTDIHCVTRWSRFDTSFRGVHWRELAKLARPKPTARFVVAHAEQGFTSNLPLEAIEADEAMIAWEADGEPLDARPRLAAPARRPEPLLLEEREVAPRPRAPLDRRARLLGALRLPQRRRPLDKRSATASSTP